MTQDWLEKDSEKWKDTEKIFQEAYDENDYETMWKCVQRVCYATIKKRLVGIRKDPDDVEDLCEELSLQIMEKIHKGQRPQKLTAFISFPLLGVLYNKKQKQTDGLYSLDSFIEENGEMARNIIYNDFESFLDSVPENWTNEQIMKVWENRGC